MREQTSMEKLQNYIRFAKDLGLQKVDIFTLLDIIEQAKTMEKMQIGYSKEDVLKAGEMGEINHLDIKHIISYLDEAKEVNNKK